MGRIMGLDFGSKTVGVAMTDALCLIASPCETIVRDKENKLRPTLRRIAELCKDQEIDRVVVGLPLNMDGTAGERVQKTEEFCALLRSRLLAMDLDIPIVLWDERLSTQAADEILEQSGVKNAERKTYIDKIAAALILEDYMRNGIGSEESGKRK